MAWLIGLGIALALVPNMVYFILAIYLYICSNVDTVHRHELKKKSETTLTFALVPIIGHIYIVYLLCYLLYYLVVPMFKPESWLVKNAFKVAKWFPNPSDSSCSC